MRGIFLDRDGVINRERVDYVKSWEEFAFLPGSLSALVRLTILNQPVIIITNQSAIGRGIVTQQAVDEIHSKLLSEVQRAGGRIDDFFVCPHHPDDDCNCRKPQPGLLLQAAQRYRLSLPQCVFIGDSITDYQAALAADCKPVLVQSGRQGKILANRVASSTLIVGNLTQAVDLLFETHI